ncbi:uncharacterized protein SCODWIG_03462 [Saccharomycodes ludwigii]|uniref:Kinetochore protein NDC80 n=1 Tax=Saccharomycodes ludwigii TaxID=36035 RepID=A0A376BAS2_9ASCO|nr:uncharacterized protein SCODWIG_03462 [Saccharomycodes ludwigii]
MFRSTNATAASNNPNTFINDNINNKKINKSNDGNKNIASTNPRRSFLFSDTRSSLRISNSKKLSLATNNLSTLNSNGGGIANNSTSAATLTRDPRPLRDKNFQQIIQQEIYDYLLDEDFIIQTNYPISIKSLKQPTQRDFVTIFKWLYVRLDPGYTFKKSLESDVYSIIKTIQYPFLETINKSQISAVGGTNWPKFLGMIHWLVNVNKSLDKTLVFLDKSLVSENTQDFTILNQTFKTIDEQEEIGRAHV